MHITLAWTGLSGKYYWRFMYVCNCHINVGSKETCEQLSIHLDVRADLFGFIIDGSPVIYVFFSMYCHTLLQPPLLSQIVYHTGHQTSRIPTDARTLSAGDFEFLRHFLTCLSFVRASRASF